MGSQVTTPRPAVRRDSSPAATLHPSTSLIAGVGRSGTSWLGKLLDASPHVFYKCEPDNAARFPWFQGIPSRLEPVPDTECHRGPFERALEQSFWSHGTKLLQIPSFPKSLLRRKPWELINLSLRGYRKVTSGSEPFIALPRWLFTVDPACVHYVLKSVTSNLRLAWVHSHFPHIRLVVIIRHPGGYVSSWLRGATCFGWDGFGEKSRLDESLIPFSGEEYDRFSERYEHGSPFERELIYWVVANEVPLRMLKDTSVLKTVVYEDLCINPEKVVFEICEHCGIPFSSSIQDFIERSTSRHSEGFHDVFKDPKLVMDRWRTDLTLEQRETVERYLSESSLHHFWPG